MRLNMLGTGHATVTKCYNTCFTLSEQDQYFLVDAGGGNEILRILEEENISLTNIHEVFVSHAHTDHVMGVIWVIRMIGQMMDSEKYEGQLNIYCHKELSDVIISICNMTLMKKITNLFGNRIQFIVVEDCQTVTILNNKVQFFDLRSTKMKQFGFIMTGKDSMKLAFCGDEPLNDELHPYVVHSDWMMHEAFCLYEERDKFKPYEKHHSTAKDACKLAETLEVKNVILYHTEDSHIKERKELYTNEGKAYYRGKIWVPEDRDVIEM